MNQPLLFILIAISILSIQVNTRYLKSYENVCNTQSCNDYAELLKRNMDLSVNPCESFYEFACGKFVKETKLETHQSTITTLKLLDEKITNDVKKLVKEPIKNEDDMVTVNVKSLYASCINTDLIDNISPEYFLNVVKSKLGGWPIISNKPNDLPSTLDLLIALNQYNNEYLFTIAVTKDPENVTTKIISIGQPSNILIPRDYFDKKNNSVHSQFTSFLLTSLNYLNQSNSNEYLNDINDIFDLFKQFSMIGLNAEQMRSDEHKKMTIKKLQEALPEFPWTEFILNGILKNISAYTINENEIISIENWAYMEKFVKIYQNYSSNPDGKRKLDNYLIFIFMNTVALDFLPVKFNEASLNYSSIFTGVKNLQTREKFCIELVNNLLPLGVGRLYVNNFFSQEAKDKAQQEILMILNEYKLLLSQENWMDAESKKKAIEKAEFIKSLVGYSDEILNKTYLQNQYDFVLSNSSFLKNGLEISSFYLDKKLREYKTKENLIDSLNPAIVNAFYQPSENKIYFPAAILQSPFFDVNHPNYLNFGGIGFVIGHEITHGFDDRGRLYDKFGNYNNDKKKNSVLSNKTIEAFNNKTKCMIKQYGSYIIKEIEKHVNGNQTLGENIADNGGLKVAFKAYKKWVKENGVEPLLPGFNFTQEQLFFINSAQSFCSKYRKEALLTQVLRDVHSLPEFRILAITSNDLNFAEVFNCKNGQKNNPIDKCSVW